MNKKIKVTPLSGYVLIKPSEAEKRTASGLLLPQNEEKPQKGEVVAASASYVNEHGVEFKCPAKIGNTVYYKRWSGNEIKENDSELQIMRFEDLIAIVR